MNKETEKYMNLALELSLKAKGLTSPNPLVGAVIARNGRVISTAVVNDMDELILVSEKGIIIRMKAKDISLIGRSTQGVRVMKLLSGDRVVGIAKIRGDLE